MLPSWLSPDGHGLLGLTEPRKNMLRIVLVDLQAQMGVYLDGPT
jgi:hypothetical protein